MSENPPKPVRKDGKLQLAIPQGFSAKDPIELTVTEADSSLKVEVAEGARVEIIELVSGTKEGSKLTHQIDIEVADNAHADFTLLQNCDANAEVSIAQRSSVGANASVHFHNVSLGGKKVEQDLLSRVEGEKSESNIDWIFYGKDEEKQSLRARNVFDAADGGGEITVQGVAEQEAHTAFDGMIDITKNGRGTNTYLTETTLMLDPTAKVDAVPGLEIKTNDVKASHSATVTKVSADDLFYFSSRGIAEAEARRMYIEGFLGDLTQKLSQEKTRRILRELIASKYAR